MKNVALLVINRRRVNGSAAAVWWRRSVCSRAERGESRPAAASDAGAGERFMWERGDVSAAQSQFFSLDQGSARGPPCSAACHACPSHTAALTSVTLGRRSNTDSALWLFVSCHTDYSSYWNLTEGRGWGGIEKVTPINMANISLVIGRCDASFSSWWFSLILRIDLF